MRFSTVWLGFLAVAGSHAVASDPSLAAGVASVLAAERAGSILSLRYDLTFYIPAVPTEAIRGTEPV